MRPLEIDAKATTEREGANGPAVAPRETKEVSGKSRSLAQSGICAFANFSLRTRPTGKKTFVIEDVRWSDSGLRPRRISLTYPGVSRPLFARVAGFEYSGSLSRQTVYSQIWSGSTRFYEAQDRLHLRIRRHFTGIYEEVKQSETLSCGAIERAVMASFANPVGALPGAWVFNCASIKSRGYARARTVSLNSGSCIAVICARD